MDDATPPAGPDPEAEPPPAAEDAVDAEGPAPGAVPPAGDVPARGDAPAGRDPDTPVAADAPPTDPTFPIAEVTPEDFADPRPDAPAGDWQPAALPDAAALAAERDELAERLTRAERRTDELIAVGKRQGAMADQLHAENQVLRGGELRTALAPLIRGLARVADDLDRIRATRADDADLLHVENRIREVLHDAGVSTVSPQPGDPFDPARHQAAGAAPTGDPALDRTIAQVVRSGLVQDDGRVLRPADVLVHRLQKDSA